MKKIYLFITFLLCVASGLWAQPINNQIKDVVMPAPNAASLGKYGDIPVSYYTGIPNVGIPIHTVTDGPLSLPVSLSYHAGGMKVGEPVSWVGLGWSLQAGGMISRTVQGKPDELTAGYFTSSQYIYIDGARCIQSYGNPPQYTYATIQNGTVDAEPDIFSFSVGGYSGKFFIEKDDSDADAFGKVILVPKQDVRITYDASGSGVYRLKTFTITTPDGTKYQFGNIDNNASNKGIDINRLDESNFLEASGWHLRKVSSFDDTYSITLDYTQEKYRYNYKSTALREFDPLFNGYPTSTPNGAYQNHVVDILGWRLATIASNTSKVSFVAAGTARTDLSTTTWNPGGSPDTPKALAQIKVESGVSGTTSTYCKQFDLSQSYYEDATADRSGTPADKRLKLTQIQEKACNDVNYQVRPYTFEYYEDTTPGFLPTRMSSAIDHWGYFNGALTNVHSGLNIPPTTLSYTTRTSNPISVTDTKGTSNRSSNEDKMKLGTLKKITYPTGGSTTFEFEANTYYANQNIKVGGLRVKKITNNDGVDPANNVVKTYVYEGDTPGLSSGLLYGKPVYGHIVQGCLGGCSGVTDEEACPSGVPFDNHFFFETSVVPLSSFEGYHIGYSAVKEYFGSTSSYYNIYKYFNEEGPAFSGLPITPAQPRIGLGEMQSKHQVYNGAVSAYIAYEIYGKKPETDQIGQGTYIKFNTYKTGGNSNGTAVTFWQDYQIKTRPYRIETIESFLDGKSTTTTREYNGTNHLQMTGENVTNSDGKLTETDIRYSFDAGSYTLDQVNKFQELFLLVPVESTVAVAGVQLSGTRTDYDLYAQTTGLRTTTASGSFMRPYQFKNYEGSSWVQKGEINSYHGTNTTTGRAGLPKEFTKSGWDKESYEWTTTTGLIKKRTFKDFNWQYEYSSNTALVTKITNPDGQFTEYVYDPLMRLQEVKSRANNVKTSYTYTYPTVASGLITAFGNVKSTTTFTAITGGVGTQESYQYFDGLGRNIETVHKGKTASGKDQVIATAYDNQGRVSKSFEPFASGALDGSYQAPVNNAYTLTQYEENPLNRVWKTTPPSWAATTTTYGSNSTEDAVKNFNFSDGTSTNFGSNLLGKVTVADGNGNKTISFTDKKGRLLLSRKADAGEGSRSDTYYVYDDKDRLVRVIPPGATWNDAELVFTYQYTNNDLISEKKVPGKAIETYEYNSRDLPVKYQDPFLRTNNQWMGSKYDAYGRLTEKGVWESGSGDAIALKNKIIENIYGTAGIEIDKLKTSKVQVFNSADPVVTPTPTPANQVLQTTFNYDTYGRVSSTTGNNHTNINNVSAESVSYSYDHADNILSETRTSIHVGGTTKIVNSRLFDTWGRITQTSQSLNNGAATTISRLSYTDKDQIAQKKIGPGTNGLQQVDYVYLPNGMLSNINGTASLPGTTSVSSMLGSLTTPTFSAGTDDLFRQVLEYNILSVDLGANAQNSGNIAQMFWQTKGRLTQAYSFTYDHLDRLTNAKYASYDNASTINRTNYYGESQNFDARGNIMSIARNGMTKGTSSYSNSAIDSQTATVPSSGNRTTETTGLNSSVAGDSDEFDAPHNHLNLPNEFVFAGNNKIKLVYDGLGNKLSKTVITGGVQTYKQDYINGIELKDNKVQAIYNEEGRAFNTSASAQTYRYEYVLRDHLGNTRVVFTDKDNSGSIDHSEILSETHYYPFGKTFEGAWYNDQTASKYKYLYNGKEVSDEFRLNFYDYGARWLDPGMGSWWQIDPLSEKNRRWAPYVYGNNNPIRFIDPDGREAESIKTKYVTPAGRTILNTDDGRNDVFVVQWSQVAEFQKNVQYTSAGMRNSIGWNDYWRSEFKLLLPGSFINSLHASESGINSLVKYALSGDPLDFLAFELNEIAGQWKDPELIIGSLSAGLSARSMFNRVTPLNANPNLLSKAEYLRIQNAATRINKPITVVGSRARGTAAVTSDWDYVIDGLTSKEWGKIKNSLPGSGSRIDNLPRRIDVFKELDTSRPFITINPR